MSKGMKKSEISKSVVIKVQIDPTECPFREFRDNELATEFWGMGPAAFRASSATVKVTSKPSAPSTLTHTWIDEQTQPLPRSVRHYLHGWIRADDLAMSRWEAEVVVFEDNNGGKMSVIDTQLSHAQVLLRSSFCRKVLSACFMLERFDSFSIEHQWESFSFTLGPEGWRAKNHIYCPGMKPGGGAQHRPGFSRNGCYLVRLYYLGAWRCIWVNDQVPVDANDSPLLPFSPLLSHPPLKTVKQVPATVTAPIVHLWPLLICKALLKIAAPDMNSDEDTDCVEDELMPEFDILHALTGAMSLDYLISDYDALWKLISSEVQVFSWDDDDEATSTVKSKSTKKPSNKEAVSSKRSMVAVHIKDTKMSPAFALPGITPAHEMALIIAMVRDVPLKKPLPEPEVALWKNYRWVDWARGHGLYEAYDCPRTRFLKVNGLLKLSYAPHLLDVQSTESINFCFIRENEADGKANTKKGNKDINKSITGGGGSILAQQKEELREWVQFQQVQEIVKCTNVIYFPSMFEYTSAASCPPIRITKSAPNRSVDMPAPKAAPLYLQIDGPEENKLRISLSMLHPRILLNSGVPVVEYIERAYVLLEVFEWFIDCEIPKSKAFVQTRGYDSVEISFLPGRHFCRIWVHSRMNWQLALVSDSTLLLGTRDLIQNAAVHECPWAARFLNSLGAAFNNWIRVNRSNTNIIMVDREFYTSYQPDLEWDPVVVGYTKSHVHWMFRKALQSLLLKRLQPSDFAMVCMVLRRYFCDPDFGLPPKPEPPAPSLREIVAKDPCDCLMPEVEEHWEAEDEFIEEQQEETEEQPIVSPDVMAELLLSPQEPVTSQVCELATEELPCGILKNEREKVIKMHEAATYIQAHWRGTWVRKCLKYHVQFNPEILKLIMDNAFGNLEVLSSLMNEFFALYPGAKYAYSVASALSGVYGLHQYSGTSPVTPICKWIPYFQGVFYCHAPVKVHFDVQSTIQHSTVAVYDNDTGLQMPQAYNAHITFEFTPNNFGYTVMGHGTLNQPAGVNADIFWQLSVLTSIDNVFHVCDNLENELCTPIPLPTAAKLHLGEIFVPNRRNILGGIQIAVTRIEAVRFRVAASSHDLEMEAILRTTNSEGEVVELARCQGTGEICWPYIRLKPSSPTLNKKRSISQANLNAVSTANMSARGQKGKQKPQSAGKTKSTTKIKDLRNVPVEPKMYSIQVIAPNGWPLPLVQWKRVDEVRNMLEAPKFEPIPKKPAKEKGPVTAKEKKEDSKPLFTVYHPLPDDAYVELECSTAIGGGAFAKRNDERDLEFAYARRAWGANEPGRNAKGAQIRQEFRDEFLVAAAIPAVDIDVSEETVMEEPESEESKGLMQLTQQGPTPASESAGLEMSIETEEEAKYFTMPEQLKDKFVPLYFIPLCTREKLDHDSVLLTPDMAEAAKKERNARIEAALDRMRELQAYNETCVLGRQKKRCHMLEQLSIDSQWSTELAMVLEERDNSIAREILERNLSATKKKQDAKKK